MGNSALAPGSQYNGNMSLQPAKNPMIERHNNIRKHFQTLVDTDKAVQHHHIHTHEHTIKFDLKDLDRQINSIMEKETRA